MSWNELTKECLPLPLKPVLFCIVDGKGKRVIMEGHLTLKNIPRVFDLFSGKFKAIPKTYRVTQWFLQ